MRKYLIHVLLVFLSLSAWSQQDSIHQRNIIQLTGVIFAPDSNSVIPGVHVYVPTAGRGTTSNPYGFFTLPVLEGDSLIFSAVGFKRSYYIVPKHDLQTSLKIIITLQEDVTFLDEVSVFPYPTEEMFKEAILSMETPYQQQYNNMNAWLSSDYMSTAYRNAPNSPEANYRYYQQMQMQAMQNKNMKPQNNLLNPWAWAKFIKSLKNGN